MAFRALIDLRQRGRARRPHRACRSIAAAPSAPAAATAHKHDPSHVKGTIVVAIEWRRDRGRPRNVESAGPVVSCHTTLTTGTPQTKTFVGNDPSSTALLSASWPSDCLRRRR